MEDGPAIATLVFLVALFAVQAVFARLQRRALRRITRLFASRHLVHWRYPPAQWRAHCERLRRELWSGELGAARAFAAAAILVIAMLSLHLEPRAGLAPGAVTALAAAFAALAGNSLFGPALRAFVRLTRCRDLDYEVYIAEHGAIEIWRADGHVRAVEGHLFTVSGGAIEGVEARGTDPAEIVFALRRPLAYGFLHTEARFLVPEGELSSARAIARRLAPPPESRATIP